MSQQRIEALNRGAGALLRLGPALRLHEHKHVRTAGGAVVSLKDHQNFHENTIEQVVTQAATAGVSSTTLNSGGQIDFRVPTSHLGILKFMAIELNRMPVEVPVLRMPVRMPTLIILRLSG
jgi:hypothetical protein